MHSQDLEAIYGPLTAIFRDVFDDESLVLEPDLSASDVANWDSLSHINLIVAIERGFKIKFATREVASLKNVAELVDLIRQKQVTHP